MRRSTEQRVGVTGSRVMRRADIASGVPADAETLNRVGSDPHAPLYRVPTVVGMTGLSRSVIYRLVNEGRLKKVNLGRASMICGDSLRALIAQLRAA